MTRFYGEVGYGVSVETPPESGVWVDDIKEIAYLGNVVRNASTMEPGDSVNEDIVSGNSISIIADSYATGHFQDIKYVRWAGDLWTVIRVEVQRPRLILTLGKVYNGPLPRVVAKSEAVGDAEGFIE